MKEPANLTNIFDYIDRHGLRNWLIHALIDAFLDARKHKLKTFNEHSYEVNWYENLVKLADAILEHYYSPSPSISFIVFEPMIREIFAAPFIDRVVHHLLYELQGGWWDRHLIADSYSCRDGKGTLYAVRRVQQMMRQATENFTKNAMFLKFDLKGCFMSLIRERLLARVKWGLDRQFGPYLKNRPAAFQVYHLCLYLWEQVLLDDPAQKSRQRGPKSDWDKLPPEKSLYTQAPGEGIVIGNLTSQLVSNLFLDQLDRYIKFELGYDYYGRYVDDFFIIVPIEDYPRAKKDVAKIRAFIEDILGMTLHPKKIYCQSVYKGLPFLGARIYPHCILPSNRIQKKFEKSLRELKSGKTKDETIISYLGFLKNLDANQYAKKLFQKYDLDFKYYEEFMSDKKSRRPVPQIIKDLRKSHWQEPDDSKNQNQNQKQKQKPSRGGSKR